MFHCESAKVNIRVCSIFDFWKVKYSDFSICSIHFFATVFKFDLVHGRLDYSLSPGVLYSLAVFFEGKLSPVVY